MAKRKAPQQRREMSPLEKLGLRVSTMINAPKAQLDRKVTIHRLDTDTDEAWDGVMEILAETDGIEMEFNDDESVTLKWGLPTGEDLAVEEGELMAVEESPF